MRCGCGDYDDGYEAGIEEAKMAEQVVDLLGEHLEEVVVPTWNRWKRCKSESDEAINGVLGLAGEAGEVADLFKKALFHKEMDQEAREKWGTLLISELGDVIYYWLVLADLFNLSVEEILAFNKTKLLGRLADPTFTGQAGRE